MNQVCEGRRCIGWLWDAVVSADQGSTADTMVWRCKLLRLGTDQLDEAVRRGWLTRDEWAAASRRANAELRSSFGVRRILRRLIVAASLGQSPEKTQVEAWCPSCRRFGHGKPSVVSAAGDPLQLSTSCASSHLVIALGHASVGVDVESLDRGEKVPVARMASLVRGWGLVADSCPPGSSAIEVWTALEALSKTTGRGLVASEQEIERAIQGHRLDWITDQPGLVTCLATSAVDPAITTVDLSWTVPTAPLLLGGGAD